MKFNRNLFILTSIIPLMISFFLPFMDKSLESTENQLILVVLFSFSLFSVLFIAHLTLEFLHNIYSSKDYIIYVGFNFLMITLAVISVTLHFNDFRPLFFTLMQVVWVCPVLYLSLRNSKR